MKGLKLGVAVACLAAAITVFLTYGMEAPVDEIPDTPESETQWKCDSCGAEFRLTARRFHEEEARAGATDERGIGPLICPECSKTEAWLCAKCGKHGTVFFVAAVPESRGECPDCNPAPEGGPDRRRDVEEEEEEESPFDPEERTVPNF